MTMEKVVWSLEGHIFRQALLPIYLDMNITKYYPHSSASAVLFLFEGAKRFVYHRDMAISKYN